MVLTSTPNFGWGLSASAGDQNNVFPSQFWSLPNKSVKKREVTRASLMVGGNLNMCPLQVDACWSPAALLLPETRVLPWPQSLLQMAAKSCCRVFSTLEAVCTRARLPPSSLALPLVQCELIRITSLKILYCHLTEKSWQWLHKSTVIETNCLPLELCNSQSAQLEVGSLSHQSYS